MGQLEPDLVALAQPQLQVDLLRRDLHKLVVVVHSLVLVQGQWLLQDDSLFIHGVLHLGTPCPLDGLEPKKQVQP